MVSLSSPGIHKASGLFVLLGGTGNGRGWKNRVSHLAVGEVVGLDGEMSTCHSVEGSPGRKLPENLYQLTADEDPIKQICSEIEKVVEWVDIVE